MLTVLHTESSTIWGGQQKRILVECAGLQKRGVRPLILCPTESKLAKRAESEGFEVRPCRIRKSYHLHSILTILRVIRSEGVDVISTHSSRDGLFAALAGRLSRRKPRIVRTRHAGFPIRSRVGYGVLPHAVVTVSEYVRRSLVSRGIDPERVRTIPDGIDMSEFDPAKVDGDLKKEWGVGEDTQVVGTIAMFREEKGHRILIDAMPRILEKRPRTMFILAGSGPEEENIRNGIRRLGISGSVIVLGFRPDVPRILKSIDLFALPSLQEALGTACLEALAMGKGVVATRVEGLPEVIQDGVNGWLVEPGNADDLANGVVTALQDVEETRRRASRGQEWVRERYGSDLMCDRMLDLYRRLLRERAP